MNTAPGNILLGADARFATLDPATAAWVTATAMADNTLISNINAFQVATKDLVADANKVALYPMLTDKASNTDRLEQFKFNFYNPVNSNAAFRLVYSGTITAATNSIQGNGVNGFANTFMNPSVNFSSGNFCIFFNSRTTTTSSPVGDFGALEGGSNPGLFAGIRTSSTSAFGANGDVNVALGAVGNASGFWLIKRVGTTVTIKHNNVTIYTYTTNTNIINRVLYLLALNIAGTASSFSNKQYGLFGFYNVGTSDANDTTIYNSAITFLP